MKKLIVLFFILNSFITYSQSGVGYLNYTVYNMVNYIYGRNSYANSGADFDRMFNISNGATIYKSGVTTAQNALFYQNTFQPGSPGSYNGIKSYGWFVPKETGTYSFGVDGDDGVDIVIDGNVITSFYGPHGYGGYRYGNVDLVAGKAYTFMVRMQNVGGGWGVYAVWKRPSQNTWSVQADEVYSTKPSEPTKKANITFNLNGLDATKFSVGGNTLTSTGLVDITNSLDSNMVGNGNKASIVPGQVEWSIMNLWNGVNYIFIDARKLNGVQPTDITQVKVLDLYDGPVTFYSYDGTWAVYSLPVLVSKLSDGTSAYNSLIRPFGIYYGLSCDVSFTSVQQYKPQSVTLTTTNNLSTLYNSIVTVSDVYLAFKEVANNGLFGNQSGLEFKYGIQYKNSDVNDDGVFDETDCFKLLQHLTGTNNIVDSFTLPKTIRLIPTTTYNTIGKSNWNSITTPLNNTYSFDINTGKSTDSFDISVAWKGDVNLSHSTTPLSNGITTMGVKTMNSVISNQINSSIIGETIGGKLIVTISVDPLEQQLVGTQFQLNYDNTSLKFEKVEFTTKGNPMNYGTDKGTYINLGSLVSDGSTILDKTTEYKITFTPLIILSDILGLTSISTTDAVNKNGIQLKVKVN